MLSSPARTVVGAQGLGSRQGGGSPRTLPQTHTCAASDERAGLHRHPRFLWEPSSAKTRGKPFATSLFVSFSDFLGQKTSGRT